MKHHYTIGVEEEYLTLDAASLELRPRADRVIAATRPILGCTAQAELNLAQVETCTAVCDSLDALEAEIRAMREALIEAAASCATAIAATATHPTGEWTHQAVTPAPRYLDLESDYQQLAREQLICGCHVHVGIDDPDDRIQVMDRVRSWVPALLAFSANSPFWQGVDTGYASYRTEIFDRWPTAGPAPVCQDQEGYERLISELVGVGMIPDESYVYWHVRPSSRYPTLELRVADVMLSSEEAVILAGLFRALVRTCHRQLASEQFVPPSHEVVRAATWRACRYGLADGLIDLREAELVAASILLDRLLTFIRPDCDEEEWQQLSSGVARAISDGNGAQRQRACWRAAGSMSEVLRMIVSATSDQPTTCAPPARVLS